MRKFRAIMLITGILVAGLAISAVAQRRADRTSSAKAYYGHKPGKSVHYVKKTKNPRSTFGTIKPSKYKSRVQAKDGYIRKKQSS
jgi:hypothetical protein